MRKIILRIIGVMGILIFLPLFLFTFSDPQFIEKSSRSFVEWKLNKEAVEKVDSIQLPDSGRLEDLLGAKAKALREETERRLAAVRMDLKRDMPSIIADQMKKMLDLSCECRNKWEQRLRESMLLEAVSLEAAREQLVEFTQVKYMDIVVNLTKDVRIFLGSNAFIFTFIFAVSFLKPAAIQHLYLPGTLMVGSTLICSYFYIFEQNWFYTIIYNSYTGMMFVVYLLIVFAFLCDIIFNKARVTTEIINAILNGLGNAATVAPC